MAEYIEKEKLLEQIGEDSVGREGQYGDEWMFVDTITDMPTIEIVHCKYCIHRGTVGIDSIDCRNTPDDWFCADGERNAE